MNRQFFSTVVGATVLFGFIAAIQPIADAQERDATPVQPSFTQGEAQSDITKLYQRIRPLPISTTVIGQTH
jgi:hypothetical protein